MTGVVTGGLGYVVAAYAVSVLALGGYALSLLARRRAEARRIASESEEQRR